MCLRGSAQKASGALVRSHKASKKGRVCPQGELAVRLSKVDFPYGQGKMLRFEILLPTRTLCRHHSMKGSCKAQTGGRTPVRRLLPCAIACRICQIKVGPGPSWEHLKVPPNDACIVLSRWPARTTRVLLQRLQVGMGASLRCRLSTAEDLAQLMAFWASFEDFYSCMMKSISLDHTRAGHARF